MTDTCLEGKVKSRKSAFVSAQLAAARENNPSRVPVQRTQPRGRRTPSTAFHLVKNTFAALLLFICFQFLFHHSVYFSFVSRPVGLNRNVFCARPRRRSDGSQTIYDPTPKHELAHGTVSDPSRRRLYLFTPFVVLL